MNEPFHTPGPWRITKCRDDKNGAFYIRGVDERGYDMPLAVTRHGPELANARLIAAAPELLAALKKVLIWMESQAYAERCGVKWRDVRASGRAAIAKATPPMNEPLAGVAMSPFKDTHPTFQAAIRRIAGVSSLTPEAVYDIWRQYSRSCQAADQGALLSEFVKWHGPQLGGNAEALSTAAFSTAYICP